MLYKLLEVQRILSDPQVDGSVVERYFERERRQVSVTTIEGEGGSTDFVKMIFPGEKGKSTGGDAPTLGIIGRLGGLAARPERIGLVSDADGALVALTCAAKLTEMANMGEKLPGDVMVATHVCADAPTKPHDPVPFMDSPVDMKTMNQHEVDPAMDAILSVDATKGNEVIFHRGFAISPTVKEGYILKPSPDLLQLASYVSGDRPVVLPLSIPDITPYGNGLSHINSIMQPATATDAPVVGVALTANAVVPGCATGANQYGDLEAAARFCLEVAKAYGGGNCEFFDEEEYHRLVDLYGSLDRLQTLGSEDMNDNC